jgi:hypothetical protein
VLNQHHGVSPEHNPDRLYKNGDGKGDLRRRVLDSEASNSFDDGCRIRDVGANSKQKKNPEDKEDAKNDALEEVLCGKSPDSEYNESNEADCSGGSPKKRVSGRGEKNLLK